MPEKLHLRPATGADADAMAETVRQGFESFREWVGPAWKPPPEVSRADGIREGLRRPSVWALIALESGRVAGHVSFAQAREREEPRPEIPGMAHLWQLFVRRPWWGTGLAARLNGLAVEAAAARGYQLMRLYTPLGHARARAFYEREGWTTDGVAIPEPLLGLDLLEYRHSLG